MSDKWMLEEEFVPFAPEHAGESFNMHHCKQGAGNASMYVTLTDEGDKILAFCHHCGKRGFYDTSKAATYSEWKKGRVPVKKLDKQYLVPVDANYNVVTWPVVARQWLTDGAVGYKEAELHKIFWSSGLGRVCIPIYFKGKLACFQARRILVDVDKGPKYVTYRNFDALPFRSYYPDRTRKVVLDAKAVPDGRVVIVEDALSAIRCGKFRPTLALMGTNMNDLVMAYLASCGIKEYFIFLDDDNLMVQEKQRALGRRLELFGKVQVIHSEGNDPKSFNDGELVGILDRHINFNPEKA